MFFMRMSYGVPAFHRYPFNLQLTSSMMNSQNLSSHIDFA